MRPAGWVVCLWGIVLREVLRFLSQRARFFAALVRPLIWLLIFAVGFRNALDGAVVPPYQSAVAYELYIVPGLIGMILLFNGLQSSLSMVYDREMGSMKVLLMTPLPRWYLLTCKLAAATAVSLIQVYAFLAIAWAFDVRFQPLGYLAILPALLLSGLMLGAIGLFLSSKVRQLENFAGVMNFVIFPAFFLSTALYPLGKLGEGSGLLTEIARFNPFTHAVELVRFALYAEMNGPALAVTLAVLAVFLALAIVGYSPAKGMTRGHAGRGGASAE